jgi:hypothetical protein
MGSWPESRHASLSISRKFSGEYSEVPKKAPQEARLEVDWAAEKSRSRADIRSKE